MKQRLFEMFVTAALVASASLAYPCSMFKACVNGKTFVGNNEDYWNPETWIWVSNPTSAKLGVVYFGFDNFFPQGGINERGLVFDGFSTPPKEFTPTLPDTKNITGANFIEQVMTTCSNIAEIKKLLKSYTIEDIASAQLMFVDKSGSSMIVESGNIIIESEKSYQIATNFYHSSINGNTPVTCERYLAAQKMLESQHQPDIEYCRNILKEVHQQGHWGGTQYSNIYDLNDGVIYLYLFHNFAEQVTLSVKDLIKQTGYRNTLRSFFNETKEYNVFRKNYHDAQFIITSLGDIDDEAKLKESLAQLKSNAQAAVWVPQLITSADEQRSRSKNRNAVHILEFTCKISPRNWKASHALTEVYLADENITAALREVDRALAIRPNNPSLTRLRSSILAKP